MSTRATAKSSRLPALVAPWLLLPALACAPRSRPESFPSTSAASPQAAEAPTARAGVALQEDPPLPGEPTDGWPGLEPAAARDPHHHHEHIESAPDAGEGRHAH